MIVPGQVLVLPGVALAVVVAPCSVSRGDEATPPRAPATDDRRPNGERAHSRAAAAAGRPRRARGRSASSGRRTRSPRTTATSPGLISTLTEDCVYTVAGTGARWEGHEGAARFYTELLTAFPDIHFDLDYIVIGPQGVCEEAMVTATHQGRWLDHEPTGEKLAWRSSCPLLVQVLPVHRRAARVPSTTGYERCVWRDR